MLHGPCYLMETCFKQRLCREDIMMWSRDKTISVLGSVVLLLLLLQPASSAPGHCIHDYYNCKYGDSNQEVRITQQEVQ